MDNLDLNFLTEEEVELIVKVIERDFELKAAEKARLCRLRKSLISIDQRSNYISRAFSDGSACIICGGRFLAFFFPKRLCKSCSSYVCKGCCKYIKRINSYLCAMCSKQKDLMAMNCTWFYENIHRKYMEGGSQIVANSLSEYPRKNAISASILGMVKGTQITKFKHQIQEVTSTATTSLMQYEKLDYESMDEKTNKYKMLLHKYSESVKSIVSNIADVLYITLENYNKNLVEMHEETNIDFQVLTTLHEEVEMIVGKKINVKCCMVEVKKNKRLEDLDPPYDLETILSNALEEKLVEDHILYITEVQHQPHDKVDPFLKSKTRRPRLDSLDIEHISVSQAPSRQGTIIRGHHNMLFDGIFRRKDKVWPVHEQDPTDEEIENENDDDDDEHDSKFYKMTQATELNQKVLELWQKQQQEQEQQQSHQYEKTPEVPRRQKRDSVQSITSSARRRNEDLYKDSDTVSIGDQKTDDTEMIVENKNGKIIGPQNWLLHARHPVASLVSLSEEVPDISVAQQTSTLDYTQSKNHSEFNKPRISRTYSEIIPRSNIPRRTEIVHKSSVVIQNGPPLASSLIQDSSETNGSRDSGVYVNSKTQQYQSKIPTTQPTSPTSTGITSRQRATPNGSSTLIVAPPRKRRSISSKSNIPQITTERKKSSDSDVDSKLSPAKSEYQ